MQSARCTHGAVPLPALSPPISRPAHTPAARFHAFSAAASPSPASPPVTRHTCARDRDKLRDNALLSAAPSPRPAPLNHRLRSPHPPAHAPPMPPPVSPGDGHIHARLLPPDRHVLPSLEYVYPLKLIASSPPAAPYLTVFLLSYGGGLVSNDRINLTVLVEAHAKLCLLTQGSTKIFKRKHPTHHTTQSLTLTLHASSSLLLLPDPVQPFADSHYSQRQTVRLPPEADGASFVLLDWVSEGRSARGERWQLARFESRTEIYSARGRLLLRDAVVLDGGGVGGEALCARMDGVGCVATLVVGGPRFAGLADWVVRRYGDEPRVGRGRGVGGGGQVLWTAAAVRGFVVVKVGGGGVEEVRGFLAGLLQEEGSVVREFGAEALRCLQ